MINLTETERNAVSLDDSNYINSKGAKCYTEGDFTSAAEYYHLAAAMGNPTAISNLGYCYLYGRNVEPNLELAIAYFKIAAIKHGNIDAAYKLGDIYAKEGWGKKDDELSYYYLRMAASYICEYEGGNDLITKYTYEDFLDYPSLCLALGRVKLAGKFATKDIEQAFRFLKCAEEGYEKQIENGAAFYAESLEETKKLLADAKFEGKKLEFGDDRGE